jgi:hypothetical protein
MTFLDKGFLIYNVKKIVYIIYQKSFKWGEAHFPPYPHAYQVKIINYFLEIINLYIPIANLGNYWELELNNNSPNNCHIIAKLFIK